MDSSKREGALFLPWRGKANQRKDSCPDGKRGTYSPFLIQGGGSLSLNGEVLGKKDAPRLLKKKEGKENAASSNCRELRGGHGPLLAQGGRLKPSENIAFIIKKEECLRKLWVCGEGPFLCGTATAVSKDQRDPGAVHALKPD